MTKLEQHLSHKHSTLGRRLSLNASVRKAALQQVQCQQRPTNRTNCSIPHACNSTLQQLLHACRPHMCFELPQYCSNDQTSNRISRHEFSCSGCDGQPWTLH